MGRMNYMFGKMNNRGRKGQPKCCNCAEYVSATSLDYYRRGRCQLRYDRGKYSAVHHATAACPEWREKEKKAMKRVYIAHPLRGNRELNYRMATQICDRLAHEREVIPISPLHNFGYLDPAHFDPYHAMQLCFGLLSIADELWVFGKWWESEGCQAEICFAGCHGIPIRYKTWPYQNNTDAQWCQSL